MVSELQLFLRVADNEYLLTLDSSLSSVKGLKTPKQLPDFDAEDEDGRFLEKMYFLEETSAALNAIYGNFLSERLRSDWDSVSLPLLKKWIEEGGPEEQVDAVENTDEESDPF
jgi:hypothetical protein